ncbi:MAG: protein kinase [Hyphomonadaceae bacterium]|nr:protein kinase [Hyphomonadaceae bacterium]
MSDEQFERRALKLLEEALAHPEAEQEAYVLAATLEDIDLRGRVLSLLAVESSGAEILRTGGAGRDAEEIEPPERVGAYKVTDMIGQGGMGAVFAAERDTGDFEHKVAIKIIRPGALSEALIERFQRERQILADLAHPHIARLFDGGELPDGAPYMIMEYVDGEPISAWAGSHGKDLEGRLALFGDACAAVRHAHQNLIIHRDITPSNVLVTDAGQVKLIDFGIAKPHAASGEGGVTTGPSLASMSFTPGFAAPERATGAPANTLSDVYSLGKLLDALTEGQAGRGRELEAIIAKAAALETEARYPSVDALMEDLDNLQHGYAVEALGEGAGYRFQKFIARRRGPVAAGVAAFAALTGALIVSLNLYSQAEAARREADARFNEVRDIASTMMFDIYDEIDVVPGTVEAKRTLAEAAKTYLDSLLADARAEPDLLYDVARGRLRLAQIVGTPGFSSFSEFDDAKVYLDEAEAIVKDLLEAEPDNPDTLHLAADLAFEQSDLQLFVYSDPEASLARMDEAEAYLGRELEIRPEDYDARLLAQTMCSSRATLLYRAGEGDEAVSTINACIDTLQEMAEAKPEDINTLSNLGRALRLKAEIHLGGATSNAEEAEAAAEAALDVLARLEALGEGAKQSHLRGVEFAHWRRAFARYNLGKYDAAVEDYYDALDLAAERARRDPNDRDARRSLATYYGEMAYSLLALERYDEAEESLLGATEWFQARYDEEPEIGSNQRAIMVQHVQLHEFYKARGAEREVERCYHLAQIKHFWDVQAEAGTLLESDVPELEAYLEANPLCEG